MAEHYTATILGDRAKEFIAVFGSATVPIKSLTPKRVLFNARWKDAFVIDYDALAKDQQDALVLRCAMDFGFTPWRMRGFLREPGLSIPADECVVSVNTSPAWNF